MTSIVKYPTLFLAGFIIIGPAFAQSNNSAPTDPGVRLTGPAPGGPLPNLPSAQGQFFTNGKKRFATQEVVSGANPNQNQGNGLGPRFNLNQCSACHAQPQQGGSSPSTNPESQVFNSSDQIVFPPNTLPPFISASGPVVEARFPYFIENGQVMTSMPDGGVHDLFTVSGNPLAQGCSLSQPDFQQAINLNDIIYRIPTPVFGAGFIENIGEDTLINYHNENDGANSQFGISGTFNYNGNDGTISRFGWKAQNKSALLFAGEAYNVEMGITNELFQNERPDPDEEHNYVGLPSGCLNLSGTGYPEDTTNFTASTNPQVPSDIVMFATYMRFLAQPVATPNGYSTATTTVSQASITRGQTAFGTIGCAACHAPVLVTDPSAFNSDLSNAPANLYSDLEIHDMGSALADNVKQGTAGGDQFRTAPLWGVGQRIFFLHDGRTSNLLNAIVDHCPPVPVNGSGPTDGSEACTAEQNFEALPPLSGASNTASQQDVLNFLRSL